ncbi:MAG: hypothetical protein R2911_41975 [Caldilineaceae bacterium]
MVTAIGRDIRFWSVQSLLAQNSASQHLQEEPAPIQTLPQLDAGATAVAFHPDGSQLAIGTEEGAIYLWHLTHERFAQPLKGHTAL